MKALSTRKRTPEELPPEEKEYRGGARGGVAVYYLRVAIPGATEGYNWPHERRIEQFVSVKNRNRRAVEYLQAGYVVCVADGSGDWKDLDPSKYPAKALTPEQKARNSKRRRKESTILYNGGDLSVYATSLYDGRHEIAADKSGYWRVIASYYDPRRDRRMTFSRAWNGDTSHFFVHDAREWLKAKTQALDKAISKGGL